MSDDAISRTEDLIIATARAALGDHVRGVESLPGDWDDEMLNRLLRAVPGVFVTFAGGGISTGSGAAAAAISARWIVYTATGHASGEAARRRGDSRQAGAYELLALLLPRLHGLVVPGVGALSLAELSNLYTGTIDRKGLTVYALVYSQPMSFELGVDAAALANFETFAADFDIPPHTPEAHPHWLAGTPAPADPDTSIEVALPQT